MTSLQAESLSPLSVDGHSPTNAFYKNNGAQVATIPLQQANADGVTDLSNDMVLGVLPPKVPNNDPQADSSLCEYPGPGYSSFYSFEQCSAGCRNSTSTSEDYLGHSKPTQCYDGSGSSGHEVSQKVFSQSSIDVIPLNRIGLI